ncbi:MAG: hypothetical protein PUP92_27695 [Rhizonema sp. PD38]|nr:hypothetical protein [Rhizonema sp. PD38]
MRRIELSIPATDAPLLQDIAAALRAGGEQGEQVRAKIREAAPGASERTGKDLIAALRASPLMGADLDLGRDPSEGRTITF